MGNLISSKNTYRKGDSDQNKQLQPLGHGDFGEPPPYVLNIIIKYLSINNLCHLFSSCKYFYEFSKKLRSWIIFCNIDAFPNESIEKIKTLLNIFSDLSNLGSDLQLLPEEYISIGTILKGCKLHSLSEILSNDKNSIISMCLLTKPLLHFCTQIHQLLTPNDIEALLKGEITNKSIVSLSLYEKKNVLNSFEPLNSIWKIFPFLKILILENCHVTKFEFENLDLKLLHIRNFMTVSKDINISFLLPKTLNYFYCFYSSMDTLTLNMSPHSHSVLEKL
jgi:hypothetical protein